MAPILAGLLAVGTGTMPLKHGLLIKINSLKLHHLMELLSHSSEIHSRAIALLSLSRLISMDTLFIATKEPQDLIKGLSSR